MYLEDVIFVSTDSVNCTRIWQVDPSERDRQARQLKAEMLLLASGDEFLPIDPEGTQQTLPPLRTSAGHDFRSPCESIPSLSSEAETSTEDEPDATTPALFADLALESGPETKSGKAQSSEAQGLTVSAEV